MRKIIFKDISPNQHNFLQELYHQERWSNYVEDSAHLEEIIKNSTYTIGAFDKENLVGFIRGFSDAYSINFIQDIIVKNSNKRQGIGCKLIAYVCKRYEKVRKTVLLTDNENGTKLFYKDCGFTNLEILQNIKCFMKIPESPC